MIYLPKLLNKNKKANDIRLLFACIIDYANTAGVGGVYFTCTPRAAASVAGAAAGKVYNVLLCGLDHHFGYGRSNSNCNPARLLVPCLDSQKNGWK